MSRFVRSVCWLLTGLLVLLSSISAAMAHESRPAYLEIHETAPGQYTLLWRTPMKAGRRLPAFIGVRHNRVYWPGAVSCISK